MRPHAAMQIATHLQTGPKVVRRARTLFGSGARSEHDPEVLHPRLRLLWAVYLGLSLGSYLVLVVVAVASGNYGFWEHVTRWGQIGHLAAVVVSGGVYVATRFAPQNERLLRGLDVGGLFALGIAFSHMALVAPAADRAELVVLLAMVHVLMLRAAVVPSSAGRTLAVGLLSMAPLIVVTWMERSALGVVEGRTPFFTTAYVAMWTGVAAAATTIISAVIFGLRNMVREATRLGQYTLEERIGEGGMGVVFRAHHALLRRPAALKVLPPERVGERSLERFEREVQVTSRLQHPNTIAIYDFGRSDDGVFYYVMELLEGLTLERLVHEHGPQPAGRVVRILMQICGSLAEAHAHQLVHRDLKPANVMVCDRGGVADFVKVLDFGLVREVSSGAVAATTGLNCLVGTPAYLPPEAINSPATLDHRADLYALGCVAYFLLTGREVFESDSLIEVCASHLDKAPTPPSEVGARLSGRLEQIVMWCLEKDRESRPPSADALREALLECDALDGWSDEDARAFWQVWRQTPARSGAAEWPHDTLTIDLEHHTASAGRSALSSSTSANTVDETAPPESASGMRSWDGL